MSPRAALLAGLLLAAASPGIVFAQDDGTVTKVIELNKKALTSYKDLDMSAAVALLGQALALCQAAHLDGNAVAARTHLYLGIVYVSGAKKRALGLAEFRKAIGIDPKIRIGKSLLNPEVQSAFDEALIAGGIAPTEPGSLPFPVGPQTTGTTNSPAASGRGAGGLYHPPITEAVRGKPIELKVQVSPELEAARVQLAYLGKGTPQFLAREMTPLPGAPGWYHENIPAEASQGTRVSYYLEVENADETVIAHSGTPNQPHVIMLVDEAATPARKELPKRNIEAARGAAPGLWFVVAVGTGGGYYAGSPELAARSATTSSLARVSGVGPARLLHLAPEIGYFHNPNWIVSMQGRFQMVGDNLDDGAGWAAAGLAKVTRLLRQEGDRFRPFVSAQAGIGQIRHSTTVPSGCNTGNACKATVAGGLGLAGAGTGFTFKLNDAFAAYAALSVLAGFPNPTVNVDVNLGLALVR